MLSVCALAFGAPRPGAAPGRRLTCRFKARLEFMKKSMASHDVHALDDRGTKFRFQAEPVLRFTNPVGGSRDGAMFLWLGEGDRPAVAAQIYWNPQQVWIEEFSSLSTSPLDCEISRWTRLEPVKGRGLVQARARRSQAC